jgi:hypothetical protein
MFSFLSWLFELVPRALMRFSTIPNEQDGEFRFHNEAKRDPIAPIGYDERDRTTELLDSSLTGRSAQ